MKIYRIRMEFAAENREQAVKSLQALFAKVGVNPFVEPFGESTKELYLAKKGDM